MINPDFDRKLFEKEFEILEKARADIESDIFNNIDNKLLLDYKTMVSHYEKLLNLTRKIFKISDIQGENLIKRENEIKSLLDNAGQGFLTFGKDLTVDREYSAECIRIFGKKIGNCNILSLLKSEDSNQNEIFAKNFRNIWETADPVLHSESLNQLPEMIKINSLYLTLQPKLIYSNDNKRTNQPLVMLILTDITEKYKAQEQVEYLNYHDKLTGLFNRAYIDAWLENSQPRDNFPLGIIFADMNGMKLTNDVFGHAQGDQLLLKMAQVLLYCCREKDIVARWGGDEFLILLPETDMEGCAKVCEHIKMACKREEGLPLELSVALGIAAQEQPGSSVVHLFGVAEKRMYRNKLLENKETRRKIILAMNEILRTRCYEDDEHIERLKASAAGFAQILGFNAESSEMQNLMLLADLHDVGKVAIPQEILGKPGALLPGEYKIVRGHSETGFRVAQCIGEIAVGEAILALHERWDGQGYPLGIQGQQIPLISRIMAIVVAFDVMTHDQPYRQAMSKEEALGELKKGTGSQFDPIITRMFIDNF
ncbi:diguanylate cyclase and metal dependent phosphohydrolase [Desulfofarcimen acetoxidans DSM 771]|uniref:Diguanylate cyclase and metal dependent phosphohydrolase n=2 Tax=Desulfofarcimen acetoxidans TaxID=58138 RepID=C8VZI7_DESAS|nr:diguanylate cyclase and metal dependent phosphohydrolase [Desulfofarcimen acetoxidans DSM 771]